MFIAGILMGIIFCILLLTEFLCEIMAINAWDAVEYKDDLKQSGETTEMVETQNERSRQ